MVSMHSSFQWTALKDAVLKIALQSPHFMKSSTAKRTALPNTPSQSWQRDGKYNPQDGSSLGAASYIMYYSNPTEDAATISDGC